MLEKVDRLNNQAILLAADGAYPEAIACFKRAITIDNKNHLLWFNLGLTYRDHGELEKACQSIEAALKIQPHDEEILETLATLKVSLEDYDKAFEICYKTLQKNPHASHFWNLLGVMKFQTEEYDNAATFFEEAVSCNPYYLDALYNLKDTYNVLKNTKGEEECEKRIKELGKK